jgi:hypothetical protein
MARGHISASFHLQRSNKGPLESSRQGTHDRIIPTAVLGVTLAVFLAVSLAVSGVRRYMLLNLIIFKLIAVLIFEGINNRLVNILSLKKKISKTFVRYNSLPDSFETRNNAKLDVG